jgi:RluA family pseudouridine synthase
VSPDDFKKWVRSQVYAREGDPDRMRGDSQQSPWEFLMNFDQHILHEDADILVINKPDGINSHWGSVNKIGIEEIVRHKRGDNVRVGHRLDRDTTGVMVIAKSDAAQAQLKIDFGDKTASQMKKTYLALMEGTFDYPGVFEAEALIAKTSSERMQVVPSSLGYDAQDSLTFFKPLLVLEGSSGRTSTLTEVRIVTGRTHQIRVVAADYLKHPLIGDRMYNPDPTGAQRPLLHAFELTLRHPVTREPHTFNAPIPDDFKKKIYDLNWKYFIKEDKVDIVK